MALCYGRYQEQSAAAKSSPQTLNHLFLMTWWVPGLVNSFGNKPPRIWENLEFAALNLNQLSETYPYPILPPNQVG